MTALFNDRLRRSRVVFTHSSETMNRAAFGSSMRTANGVLRLVTSPSYCMSGEVAFDGDLPSL